MQKFTTAATKNNPQQLTQLLRMLQAVGLQTNNNRKTATPQPAAKTAASKPAAPLNPALTVDPSLLKNSRTFKSWGFTAGTPGGLDGENGYIEPTRWSGNGDNDINVQIANAVFSNPEAMAKLGLTADDWKLENAGGYQHDSYTPATYNISDKALSALSGFKLNRVGFDGLKDGRVKTVTDSAGNVVYTSQPYSYDPAKEMKSALVQAASFAVPLAPGLGAALGGALGASGLGANMLGTGLINGTLAKASGGHFLKNAVTGAASVAIPSLPGLSTLNPIAKAAISQGLTAGLSGGNAKNMLVSALLGGAGASMQGAGVNPILSRAAVGLLSGALQGNSQQGLLAATAGGLSGIDPRLGSLLKLIVGTTKKPGKP